MEQTRKRLAELEVDLSRLTEENRDLREVARLPLLFHAGGRPDVKSWEKITGTREMTTKIMCEHIRCALASAEENL